MKSFYLILATAIAMTPLAFATNYSFFQGGNLRVDGASSISGTTMSGTNITTPGTITGGLFSGNGSSLTGVASPLPTPSPSQSGYVLTTLGSGNPIWSKIPPSGGVQTLVNNTGTGTIVNHLASLDSTGKATTPSTSTTSGVIGIVTSGAGTSGSATITTVGTASCAFDGSTTAGDTVGISSSVAGDCFDEGTSGYPPSGQTIGIVLTTHSGASTQTVVGINVAFGDGGRTLLIGNDLDDVGNKTTSFNNISPMFTSGDMIYGGSGGTGTRLPIGTPGQALVVSSSTLSGWSNNIGGSTLSGGSISGNNVQWTDTQPNQGYQNFLVNAGFDDPTFNTGWSSSSMTGIVDTSNPHLGTQDFEATVSSQKGCIFQNATPPTSHQGENWEYGAWVRVGSTATTDVQVCAQQNGITVGNCSPAVNSDTKWHYIPVNYPAPSGTLSGGVSVCNTATNTESYFVDDGYVGLSRNIGAVPVMSDCIPYTPTWVGMSTPTNMAWCFRRVGDHIHVEGSQTNGTNNGSTASMSLPSSLNLDTSKITLLNTTSNPGTELGNAASSGVGHFFVVSAPGTSTSLVYFGAASGGAGQLTPQAGSSLFTTGASFSAKFDLPIAGWSSSGLAVNSNNSIGITSFTPTFNGIGTASGVNFFYRQDGSDLLMWGNFTTGTATAAPFRMSIPPNLIVDTAHLDRTNGSLIAGTCNSNQVSTNGVASASPLFIAPAQTASISATSVANGSSSQNFVELNGNTLFNSSTTYSCGGIRVPILGWNQQNAPILVGSVTSSGAGQYHEEFAKLGTNCAISSQSGSWLTLSSGTAPASGCVYTITAGEFSSAPACFMSGLDDNVCIAHGSSATTSTQVAVWTYLCTTTGSASTQVDLKCSGTH